MCIYIRMKKNIDHVVNEFRSACDRMKLNINVDRNKVLAIRKNQRVNAENEREYKR